MEKFKYQLASDVIRDGLGLELLNARGDVVAEVFRWDSDHRVTVNTFNNDVTLEELKALVGKAERDLDPFEDGVSINE